MLAVSWVLIVFLIPFSANAADAKQLDIQAISDAAGTKASMTADGVARIGWSRDKVPVEVDGLDFPSAAGLGSWAAFKPVPAGGVMVMGDTVVFEDEITPAMDAAFAHGLEITALHNHFVFDRPPAYFMHIGGHAQNAAELARGVKAIWDAIKGVREARPVPADRFAGTVPNITGEYDTAALEKILKAEGKRNGKVVKFTFERTASMHGAKLGESLGLATWAAFSGNQGHAVVDGDFAMTAAEVQPVMHALRKAGLHIVALHNHMIGETPAYYFLHYWGKGEPQQLAQGVRAALDTQQR
ncbi:DUF1259 domain-containing protein [Proteobacteria bacterium 005FR1]|nr:DUF1259 domain-containing protein [Proteobacteria bacterium 005FR1]